MGETGFVSVVVPTRDRAEMLRDCLSSLLRQDYSSESYQIIVVDDGSSDGTSSVLAELRTGYLGHDLRAVRSWGRGLNAARNNGIRAARGDLVIFVDDDVDAPPTWLKRFVEGASRHENAGCLGGPIRLRLEGKAPRFCGREPLGETELDLGSEEVSVRAVWGANMGIRRWAADLVGMFDESLPLYGDEEEWQHRIRTAGISITYLPDAWLWHRRTQRDLRLRNLARVHFRRGIGFVAIARATGQSVSIRTELAKIPRYLAHGVLRRCSWGFLASATQAGRVWACVRGK